MQVLQFEIPYLAKLDFGASTVRIDGYLSVDINPLAKPDVPIDVFRQMPLPDNHVSAIRAAHLLEHAPYAKTIEILKEWNRVLVPGGVLELYVPNMAFAAIMILTSRLRGKPYIPNNAIWGEDTLGDNYLHRSGFTAPLLRHVLQKSGFVNIKIRNGRKKLHSGWNVGGVLNRIFRSELYAVAEKETK